MDKAKFYDVVRKSFGPLSQTQVDGFEQLLGAAEKIFVELHQLAYVFATTWHETASTMQPIAEYGKGAGHPYGEPTKYNGQVAYGRGYVQLTWVENYERADAELGLNGALLRDFDRALRPDIASAIIFRGMMQGWFTSKALPQYVSAKGQDYYNARRVVNGVDKADLIKGYALNFEAALEAASYEEAIPMPEPPPTPVPPSIDSVAMAIATLIKAGATITLTLRPKESEDA